MNSAHDLPRSASPWPSRLTFLAALFALPLVLFGGSVTTIGAGMAVEGWLVAEGHFLVFFPVDAWFRDVGTFVEHTHRLWGVLVGMACVLSVLCCWRAGRGLGPALLALGMVLGQGALGGFRVLENSPQLAFLHGVFGQVTLAVLIGVAVVLSKRWQAAPSGHDVPRRAGWTTLALTLVLVGQIVLGARYRHDLRPVPNDAAALGLLLHMAGAVAVLVAVIVAAKALKSAGRSLGADGAPLTGSAKRLHALFGLQVVLGLLAWAGYRADSVGPLEWGLSIAHVLFGGLFLAQAAVAWLWCGRLGCGRLARRDAVVGKASVSGGVA
ncbi:MAG: COX15/CtaA family protein [Planctomycetota bacterium]